MKKNFLKSLFQQEDSRDYSSLDWTDVIPNFLDWEIDDTFDIEGNSWVFKNYTQDSLIFKQSSRLWEVDKEVYAKHSSSIVNKDLQKRIQKKKVKEALEETSYKQSIEEAKKLKKNAEMSPDEFEEELKKAEIENKEKRKKEEALQRQREQQEKERLEKEIQDSIKNGLSQAQKNQISSNKNSNETIPSLSFLLQKEEEELAKRYANSLIEDYSRPEYQNQNVRPIIEIRERPQKEVQKPTEVSKPFVIPKLDQISNMLQKEVPIISEPLIKKVLPPPNWQKGDIIVDISNLIILEPSEEYKFDYAEEKFFHFKNGKTIERIYEKYLFNISLDLRNLKF